MTDPLVFALAALLLLGVPGPTNAALATAAASGGRPWPLLGAVLAGYVLAVTLARLLLVPLVAALPPLGPLLKLAVALYLGYVAVRLWRSRPAGGAAPLGAGTLFLVTLTNPKSLVIAVSILPAAHPLLAVYGLGLAAILLLTSMAWYGLGRLLAHLAAPHARLIPRGGALVLAALAMLLAMTAYG